MDASAQLLAPAPANTMPDAVTMPPVWVVANMTDADALRLIPDELIVHWNLRQLFGMHVDGMQVDRTSGEDDKWPQRTYQNVWPRCYSCSAQRMAREHESTM